MSIDYASLSAQATALDSALRPIANRLVDINDPDWVAKFRGGPHPLDRASVREKAERLLGVLLDNYSDGDEKDREAIRELLAKNSAFTWATGVPGTPTTPTHFRLHLLRLSAENGGGDMRDTIVSVDSLCERARQAGVDIAPILEEVAALSSTMIIHRMTSMRDVLLRAHSRYANNVR